MAVNSLKDDMKTRAFTLLELLICLSICAIITTNAVPSIIEWKNKSAIKIQSDKLHQYLNFARLQAINSHKTTTICSSIDEKSCAKGHNWSNRHIIIFIDSNDNHLIDHSEQLLLISDKIDQNIHLSWRVFGNKHYLKWLNTGMTDYQNGSFTLCHSNKNNHIAKQLIVNVAGRIYYAKDNNHDGIVESSQGRNIRCR